jgi:branched-chain amino acid transport system substrate-binding protein
MSLLKPCILNNSAIMKTYRLPIILFALCITIVIGCKNSGSSDASGDTTGVTDTEITLGAWGPMSGPAALWGTIIKGTDAYFKMINDEGGINGRKINFVFKDDAYDPSRTVPAVRELVQKDEIFAVAGGLGTAPNMAVMGFLEENNVPWITPMSGATHWTHPTKSNIYTTFPLYFDEGEAMANFSINDLDIKKIGIIYQNDDFGKSGLVGAKNILKKNDLEFVAELPVEITDTDLSSHVARLKEAGAEAVFLWVMPRQAAIILGNSAVVDFNPEFMASMVLSDLTLMYDITKGAWEGVYFTYVGESMFNDESNPTMMKYKEAFAKYYPDDRWGTFSAAGFMWIEPVVEGLKRAGKDLTRESFLEAMSTIKNHMTTSGLPITFSKENHLGTRSLCIMKCISGTEAERVGDQISSESDVSELITMLEGS